MIVNSLPHLPATPPADGVRSATYREMIRMNNAGQLSGPPTDVFRQPRPEISLHDVVADPHCLKNVAGDANMQTVAASLAAALDAFADLTNDHFSGDPESLTPDGFDRQSGERLKKK